MSTAAPPPDEDLVVLPALLRHARGAYRLAVRDGLARASFDDLPRNGPYVLGGMANRGVTLGDLIAQLGVSKQAASQLVDMLVIRGYLHRRTDPEDRRRMEIDLTERGRAAAVAVRDAVEWVDGQLSAMLSTSELAGLRAGLVALCDIKERLEEHPEG